MACSVCDEVTVDRRGFQTQPTPVFVRKEENPQAPWERGRVQIGAGTGTEQGARATSRGDPKVASGHGTGGSWQGRTLAQSLVHLLIPPVPRENNTSLTQLSQFGKLVVAAVGGECQVFLQHTGLS